MDRRAFVGRIAGTALLAPLGAFAQATGKIYRIGYLLSFT